MSVKKKLFGLPATLLGILLGLVAGGLAIAKELFEKKFPKIGLAIMLLTPLVAFVFEQVMSRAFPEAYWERLAGNLLKVYRYVINQGFRLRFIYELRFVMTAGAPQQISPQLLCKVLGAAPGGDPEPGVSGDNFVQLQFREPPFLVSIRWYVEQPEIEEAEEPVTIFHITMEPEIRDIVMRRAKDDIDGIVTRLGKLQESLLLLFKVRPETLAIADAWLGDTEPAATPIRRVRKDKVSGGEYRVFPGRLHVAGTDLSVLGAVYRYVGTLEEPPDPE